ncbi:MAG: PQQ-dependent sugar dehydrogenase [Gammaproteobacteria bacterium]|jgi:glucose/arabinose dehydrogenase|nr:PQQ-dependent sugar dehydrogenase [Gammaproteobacteria bacterium]MDP6653136.1 PQQ-dependent sugar dehydrogenase [Gammaproteobacteria bacterium]
MSRAAGFTQLVMLVALFVLSNVGYTQSRESPSVQITPTQPFIINTFEVPEVRVVPVATGLANPFDMAFRDNGDILITERYSGKVRVVRDGNLLQSDITGVPEIYSEIFRAGLMAIALHPDDDRMVYLTYHKPLMVDGEPEQTVTLARARLVENTLTQVEEIFVAEGLDRAIAASQLLFTTDNKLMMSIGGAYVFAATGDLAQDPGSHYGKLLRLNADGSVPDDNPFVSSGEYLPEVYSVGHRNQIGLSFHPETGELWATENGPQGGDEANIIQPGENYGWPIVSYSRQYRGDRVSDRPWSEEFVDPQILWWPSIAPAGLTFYSGEQFPQWQGNLFVGSMMEGRIPGTGHLERVVFNSRGEEIRREGLLRQLRSRITGVYQGPDGNLYVLIDEENGALLRLEPVQ